MRKTRNTARVAQLISGEMGDLVESVKSIAQADRRDVGDAEALMLGVSTWADGQLQYDWKRFLPRLDEMDLSGKTIALFGLGDARGYSGEFVMSLRSVVAAQQKIPHDPDKEVLHLLFLKTLSQSWEQMAHDRQLCDGTDKRIGILFVKRIILQHHVQHVPGSGLHAFFEMSHSRGKFVIPLLVIHYPSRN